MGQPRAAAIYCRISKDIQGSGLGVERQEALARGLADTKGWPVASVYTDNDISAYSGSKRPAYEAMLADIANGTIDAVICVDLDRLTRHPAELESFIALADAHSVALANVSGDIDLSSSDGRFRARIMGAVARQESEKKSERIRRQKEQSATKGWASGGRRRYGYTHVRGDDGSATLEVVEDEAEIVREMADRVLGGESVRSVAIDLNARGVPTVRGGRWQVTTIRTILTGPHIAGLRVHHDEIVGEGNWKPILDRGTWERIRLLMGDPRRKQGGRPPAHLLTGLLKCGRCGGNLRHATRSNGGRYVCDPQPKGCGRLAISDQIEARVLEEASTRSPNSKPVPVNSELERLAAEIDALDGSMKRLAAMHFAEGYLSEGEYLTARESIEAKKAELDSGLRSMLSEAPLTDLLLTPDEREGLTEPVDLAGLSVEDQRKTLAGLISEIVVAPGQPGSKSIDYGRLSIAWR